MALESQTSTKLHRDFQKLTGTNVSCIKLCILKLLALFSFKTAPEKKVLDTWDGGRVSQHLASHFV